MRKLSRPRPAWAVLMMFGLVLAYATPGWAWIDTGHKVVAFVAWEDLTPAARKAVTTILKGHPRYEKDLLSGGSLEPVPAEATAGMSADELDRRAFVAAAVWPDLIKAPAHPMRFRYGHSNWHFIDIPYIEPATQPAAGGDAPPAPPAPDPAEAPAGPRDAVEALKACLAELKDPATKLDQRAVDVCWINHLVGDIHQPLHAATMISPEFPKGDAGGNSEMVLKDARYTNTRTNLHLLWDSLPGDFASDDLDRYEAQGLHGDPNFGRTTFAQQLAKGTDFMAWAKESHQLAVDDAYLDGHLKFAVGTRGGRQVTGTVPGVPPGYMRTAEHIAMRQVTLAGYRLADLLNAALDPASKP